MNIERWVSPMMYNTKNGTLAVGGDTMDYISFGSGGKTLIMLPGLGDGLKTVKGSAAPFALMYRAYAEKYRVFIFSRTNNMAAGYTTEDMAREVRLAMDALDISCASVMGISLGGMIAQHFALNYPGRVEKLVLAVTLARQTPTLRDAVNTWIALARQGDYKGLITDTAERSYSDAYLRAHRGILSLLGAAGRLKDPSRFIIQAEACLRHDAYARLPQLKCPTLVLGGSDDRIVGAQAAGELAGQISGCELFIFDGLGHAAYEEAKDFNLRALDFLNK